jgi:hypothetical protein
MERIHFAQYVKHPQAVVNKLMNICFHGIHAMSSLAEELRDSHQGLLMFNIAFRILLFK